MVTILVFGIKVWEGTQCKGWYDFYKACMHVANNIHGPEILKDMGNFPLAYS